MTNVTLRTSDPNEFSFLLVTRKSKSEGKLVVPSGIQHPITIMEARPSKSERFLDFISGSRSYTPITQGSLQGKWLRLENGNLSKTDKKLVKKALKTLSVTPPLIIESENELQKAEVQALQERLQIEGAQNLQGRLSSGRVSPLTIGKSFSFYDDKIIVTNNSPPPVSSRENPPCAVLISDEKDSSLYSEATINGEESTSLSSSISLREETPQFSSEKDPFSTYLNTSDPMITARAAESSPYQNICPEIEFLGVKPYDQVEIPKLPVFSRLIARTMREGDSSALIFLRGLPFRLYLKKDPIGSVMVTTAEPRILVQDLNALIEARFFTHEEVENLQELFSQRVDALCDLASRQLKKKQAGIVDGDLYMQVHLKKDGSISVGFAKKLRKGYLKSPRKMAIIGVVNKQYVEAPIRQELSRDSRINFLMECEQDILDSLRHPCLAEKLKDIDKEIPVIDAKTGQVMDPILKGFKSPFYAHGSADTLTDPPQNFQELLLRLHVACDAAEGLVFLHSQGFVHGDIKPSNIFISEEDRGVVGDLAPIGEGKALSMYSEGYIDPQNTYEKTMRKRLLASKTSDVWAFGETLFEMIYGSDNNFFRMDEYKYDGSLPSLQKICDALNRLFRKRSFLEDINRLLLQIFTYDRETRPTMKQVHEELEAIIQRMPR